MTESAKGYYARRNAPGHGNNLRKVQIKAQDNTILGYGEANDFLI
jgi:hypothetical protein